MRSEASDTSTTTFNEYNKNLCQTTMRSVGQCNQVRPTSVIRSSDDKRTVRIHSANQRVAAVGHKDDGAAPVLVGVLHPALVLVPVAPLFRAHHANAQIGRFAEACAQAKGVGVTRRGAAVAAAGQCANETWCAQMREMG